MVIEAVQNYVNMVNGLNKANRERAMATAKALLAHAGLEDVANDASERVAKLAEEILLASRANRELVENLVAAEVDKAAGRWGFVRTSDVDALREEIAELRVSLARATVKAAEKPAKKTSKKAPAWARTATPSAQQPPLGGASSADVAPPTVGPEPVGADIIEPEGAAAVPTPPEASTPIKGVSKKTAAKKAAPKSNGTEATAAKRTAPSKKAATSKTATAKKAPAARKTPAAKKAIPLPAAALVTPPPVLDPDAGQ